MTFSACTEGQRGFSPGFKSGAEPRRGARVHAVHDVRCSQKMFSVSQSRPPQRLGGVQTFQYGSSFCKKKKDSGDNRDNRSCVAWVYLRRSGVHYDMDWDIQQNQGSAVAVRGSKPLQLLCFHKSLHLNGGQRKYSIKTIDPTPKLHLFFF